MFDYFDRILPSGLEPMVMESNEILEKVTPMFYDEIRQGHNPNQVKDAIFERARCNENDLLPCDAEELVRRVDKYWRLYP